MHDEYAITIARLAYVWGWPMVNMINRRTAITKAPEPGRLNGVLPCASRGQIGQPYQTPPGFYLLVGPNWKGDVPAGVTGVVRSSTSLANAIPRVFMDDTDEDRKAIQAMINQIVSYPLKDFDGKMKTKDAGLACSILAGQTLAVAKPRAWTHMIAFAFITCPGIFMILEIEFPAWVSCA